MSGRFQTQDPKTAVSAGAYLRLFLGKATDSGIPMNFDPDTARTSALDIGNVSVSRRRKGKRSRNLLLFSPFWY
jgi:hypothetical protein